MINHQDTQEQAPQPEKLVLPAPPDGGQHTYYGGQKPQLQPEQLIRRRTEPVPRDVFARVTYYWRKDSAYKVLMVAMVVVLIAGIVFVSLASAAFFGNSSSPTASSSPQTIPTGVNPTGTVDLRPNFPTPGGGSGSSQSSQPPLRQTPSLQPTNSDQSSPTPGNGGSLTVQFTNIPTQVANGSRVQVGVNTSEPGATVTLVVRYNVQPYRATAGPAMTDGNGDATLSWFVFVFVSGQKSAQATVYVAATDQNGQHARSQAVNVQIGG